MNQKAWGFLAGLVLFLAGTVQGDEPREVQMARRQYKNEIGPATQRYINNLDMIKRRYEQKNDHDGIAAVDLEEDAVQSFLNRTGPVVETREEKKDQTVAGKCLLFHPPDDKWLKILYFRPDGKILGGGNPNEVAWELRGMNLLLLDAKGQISGTYKYVKQKDDRMYFECSSGNEVFVILEEPKK